MNTLTIKLGTLLLVLSLPKSHKSLLLAIIGTCMILWAMRRESRATA